MKQYLLISAIILSIGTISCTNPFTTRANLVEKPKPDDVGFETPTTPEIVMDNFILAIQNKDVAKYMESFNVEPPVFQFEPDPHYFEDFQAISWRTENERNFFDQLTKSVVSMYFNFTEADDLVILPIDVTAPDDSMFTDFVDYKMTVNFNQEESTVFEGSARFKLFHNHQTQKWHIYYWQDRALDEKYDLCMTALKLFYNNKTL